MHILRIITGFCILLIVNFSGHSQVIPTDTLETTDPRPESVIVDPDSVTANIAPPLDTLPGDTVTISDSLAVPQEGDIKTYINYTARDSILFDVVDKIVYLYGDAKIEYGDITLEAAQIEINWKTNILTATGVFDTAGVYIGRPQFTDAEDKYVADTIRYNITTKKGIIIQVVTQEGEGYIHADRGRKDEYNNLYFNRAKYTTCNLQHPHFYIGANKLKVIPEDKVVSGPFNLYIADVPTPLGFILGYFPIPEKRTSGIIFPRDFGEHSTRGFYFTQGGYYLAVKEYLGITLLGDLYSNGSWRATLGTDYRKRYAYNGTLNFNFSKIREGFDEDPGAWQPQYNFFWNHSSDTRGLGRFSANVNAGSFQYYQNFSYNPTSILAATFQSTINYYTTFRNTPFNLGVTLSQDQNTQTKVSNLRLPVVNFSVNRVFPFKKKIGSRNNWYESFSFSYNLTTELRLTNLPTTLSQYREIGRLDSIKLLNGTYRQETLNDTVTFRGENIRRLLDRSQYGALHSIPLATTFKVKKTFLKYFSINPNANINLWTYGEEFVYQDLNGDGFIDTTFLDQKFSAAYQYNAGVSLNTWFYGTLQSKRGKIAGVRHSVNPTAGFSYKPDYSLPQYGIYTTYWDTTANQWRSISRYDGFIYGGPSQGENQNINFSIDNILEAKLRTKDTAEPIKKIKLIDRFGISGFYNMAADSFQLSNLNVYANTRIFGIFDIRFNGVIDPYFYSIESTNFSAPASPGLPIYTVQQRRTQEFAFTRGQGLGRFVSTNFSIGANFNPQAFKPKVVPANVDPVALEQINARPNLYVDFTIPWTLSLNYIINVNQNGFQNANVAQSITASGDIKLTDNWKFGYQTGFDIKNKGFSVTRLEIFRDLHCWQMSISVILFSTQQSYMFSISPKASILQDLRLNKRSPGSFGQPVFF